MLLHIPVVSLHSYTNAVCQVSKGWEQDFPWSYQTEFPLARKEKRSDGEDGAQGKAGNTVDQDCVAYMFHCHYSGWRNGSSTSEIVLM